MGSQHESSPNRHPTKLHKPMGPMSSQHFGCLEFDQRSMVRGQVAFFVHAKIIFGLAPVACIRKSGMIHASSSYRV